MQCQTTALYLATEYSSPVCVDLLIEAGADLTAKDNHGRTCLLGALEHPNKRILGLFWSTCQCRSFSNSQLTWD